MRYYLLLFTLLMGCDFVTVNDFFIVRTVEHGSERKYKYRIETGSEDRWEWLYFESNTLYSIGDTIGAKPDLHRDWMRELSEKQNTNIGK